MSHARHDIGISQKIGDANVDERRLSFYYCTRASELSDSTYELIARSAVNWYSAMQSTTCALEDIYLYHSTSFMNDDFHQNGGVVDIAKFKENLRTGLRSRNGYSVILAFLDSDDNEPSLVGVLAGFGKPVFINKGNLTKRLFHVESLAVDCSEKCKGVGTHLICVAMEFFTGHDMKYGLSSKLPESDHFVNLDIGVSPASAKNTANFYLCNLLMKKGIVAIPDCSFTLHHSDVPPERATQLAKQEAALSAYTNAAAVARSASEQLTTQATPGEEAAARLRYNTMPFPVKTIHRARSDGDLHLSLSPKQAAAMSATSPISAQKTQQKSHGTCTSHATGGAAEVISAAAAAASASPIRPKLMR